MSRLVNRHRAFRQPPSAAAQAPRGQSPALNGSGAGYGRLMQVVLTHDYYNGNDRACTDLVVQPTVQTADLMRDIGMLLHTDGTTFSAVYDLSHAGELFNLLRRERTPEDSPDGGLPGYWTRLSFTLSARNPDFVNISDLPVGMRPRERNHYLSNSLAPPPLPGGPVELAPALWNDGVPVWPQREELRVARGETVTVRSVSQALEICMPSCVPVSLARRMPPDAIDCAAVEAATGGKGCARCDDAPPGPDPGPRDCVYRDRVYVDFSLIPEGLHTVARIRGLPGRSRDAAGETVLHTGAIPIPMFFIDLFFSPANGGDSPCYPVRGLADPEPLAVPVVYSLRFRARSTHWVYVVSARPGVGEPIDPVIRDTADPPEVRFVGPYRVRLANGAAAVMFISRTPLALQQRPSVSFKLCGRREKDGPEVTLVEPLPAAGPDLVLPLTPDQAIDRLAAAADPVHPDRRGLRRMERFLRSLPHKPEPVFSNIFVTV